MQPEAPDARHALGTLVAVTAYLYGAFFTNLADKLIDFDTDDIAAILTTSSYTPNQDTHNDGADVTNEVAEANGYLQGFDGTGELLGTKSDGHTANVYSADSADPAWTATGAGITARILVLADVATATAATDPLIMWTDFGTDETASGGGTFTYNVNASGWLTITAADAP